MDSATVTAIAEAILASAACIGGVTWVVRKIIETVRTSSFKAARQVAQENAVKFDNIMNNTNSRVLRAADRADRSQYILCGISLAAIIVACALNFLTGKILVEKERCDS